MRSPDYEDRCRWLYVMGTSALGEQRPLRILAALQV